MSSRPRAVQHDLALRVVAGDRQPPATDTTGSETRRRLALETVAVTGWELDLVTGAVTWDVPLGALLTVDPRDATNVPGPRDGGERTVADVEEWLLAPVLTSLRAAAPWRDYELEQTVEGPEGQSQQLLVRARTVQRGRRVVGCSGIVVDVTDRRRADSAFHELIDRYRLLVELSPDGIVVHQDGVIRYVNRAGLDRVGATSAEEVFGRSIVDFLHPDSLRPTLARIARLTEEHAVSEPAEATLVRLDGSPWPVESVSVRTRWEGRPAYQVILRDLSDRKRAERSLRYQASLVEHVSDAIIGVDPGGRVESWNNAAERIYGIASEAAIGRPLHEVLGSPVEFATAPVRDVESVHVAADGTPIVVRASVAPMFDERGNETGRVVLCADTTERRRAEDARREMQELHTTVVDALDEGIVVADRRGLVVAANPAAQRILPLGAAVGAPVAAAITGPDGLVDVDRRVVAAEAHPALRTLRTGVPRRDELLGLVGPEERWLSVNCRPLPAATGASTGVVCSFTDITEHLRAQHELSYRATHDDLTGLCTRVVFVDALERALARARRAGTHVAVLFVDLDRFKLVNDTFGHASGDEVLVEVARRLRDTTPGEDRISRLPGDELIVMWPDVAGIEHAAARAADLARLIARPVWLSNERRVVIEASIGVAFARGGVGAAEELLRDADVAMHRAKKLGGARVEVFDRSLRAQAEQRRRLELGLRAALENGDIEVHYQPIASISRRRIVGVEALARFDHPGHGPVPPSDFIRVAEETGLILPLGIVVLRTACAQAAVWRARHPAARDLHVSVNLSARQLFDPNLVDAVATTLAETGLDPDALWLEITESMLMEDAAAATRTLRALRRLGVHLIIDDFGTGYSSLVYLHRFPVEMLKIDRAFVDGLGRDAESEAIVRAVIGLARSLNLAVVAEGVERHAQLARLRELGCDLCQGYLVSPALPHDALDLGAPTVRLAEPVPTAPRSR